MIFGKVLICPEYFEELEAVEISPSFAAVEQGIVQVQGNIENGNYRSTEIEVLEFWHYTPEQRDYKKVVYQLRGEGCLTAVVIPETPYQLILLDGFPQPFLLDTGHWKLWYIEGLGRHFVQARLIVPGDRCITLCLVENLNNFDLIWKFDFSDPQSGFKIEYDCTGIF